MGQAMADLLLQAKLPEPVHEALLGRPGPYRDALLLAIATEGQSPQELQRQAALCGLESWQVSQCAIQSLAWRMRSPRWKPDSGPSRPAQAALSVEAVHPQPNANGNPAAPHNDDRRIGGTAARQVSAL